MSNSIDIASEVWIATAMLHYENPGQEDFSVFEIKKKIIQENIYGELRPGVNWFINVHCVANTPPNQGENNYRMLYGTRGGYRRLWKQGDDFHPERENGKTKPGPGEIPEDYSFLLDWYDEWCTSA